MVIAALTIAAAIAFIVSLFTVLIAGEYPRGIRDFLIAVYRYGLRVQAYVGLLTDQYPPFRLGA